MTRRGLFHVERAHIDAHPVETTAAISTVMVRNQPGPVFREF
jgi:hypothetical protein